MCILGFYPKRIILYKNLQNFDFLCNKLEFDVTMKKQSLPIAYICLFSLLVFIGCDKKTALIEGNIENANKRTLYFEEINVSKRSVIDSVKLGDKGTFSFTYKFVKDEPTFIVLRTDSVALGTLLLEKGETVNYSADFKRLKNYTVKGSEGSIFVKQLNDELINTSARLDSLARILQNADGTDGYDTLLRQIDVKMGSVAVKHKQFLARFIKDHSTSYASFTAIYQRLPGGASFFGKNTDLIYYKTLVDSLSVRYPNSDYVRVLNDDYKSIENVVIMQDMFNNAQEHEGMLDIELPNTEDRMVKLSSLQAKVILIDFWAPFGKEQLMDNRELIDIYNKYNSKGFEIYQISEGKDKDKWKQVVNNQELKWVSVMDNQQSYAALLYNVSELPANYLIDASGEIIGKNLFGDKLDKKLNEILSK